MKSLKVMMNVFVVDDDDDDETYVWMIHQLHNSHLPVKLLVGVMMVVMMMMITMMMVLTIMKAMFAFLVAA